MKLFVISLSYPGPTPDNKPNPKKCNVTEGNIALTLRKLVKAQESTYYSYCTLVLDTPSSGQIRRNNLYIHEQVSKANILLNSSGVMPKFSFGAVKVNHQK